MHFHFRDTSKRGWYIEGVDLFNTESVIQAIQWQTWNKYLCAKTMYDNGSKWRTYSTEHIKGLSSTYRIVKEDHFPSALYAVTRTGDLIWILEYRGYMAVLLSQISQCRKRHLPSARSFSIPREKCTENRLSIEITDLLLNSDLSQMNSASSSVEIRQSCVLHITGRVLQSFFPSWKHFGPCYSEQNNLLWLKRQRAELNCVTSKCLFPYAFCKHPLKA